MKAEAPDPKFDPSVGLATADTWWQLGKRLSVCNDPNAIADWASWTKEKLGPSTVEAAAVTPGRLKRFADDTVALLKAKSKGQSVQPRLEKLLRQSCDYEIREEGEYVDLDERDDVFWANEYRFLVVELSKPKDGRGWLNAVHVCDNCGEFFVKARRDQRYHNDACRMRAANARAYKNRPRSSKHRR